LSALLKIAPSFLSYLLSFLVVAIMWVNHHHFMHAAREVNARLLWLNMNLLFWMSLVPFVTDFMGKNHNQPFPVALYGLDLACCSVAFCCCERNWSGNIVTIRSLLNITRRCYGKMLSRYSCICCQPLWRMSGSKWPI